MKPQVQYLLEYYIGEKISDDSDDSPERSCENEDYIEETMDQIRSFDEMIHLPENPRAHEVNNAELSANQRENIRVLGQRLQTISNFLHLRPRGPLLAINRAVLLDGGLNEGELQVVNNIHFLRNPVTISKVAEYLEEKLTSRTLQAAFRFLCCCVSSVPEELSVICELVKITYPKIQQVAHSDSIYDAIEEFIEERLHANS